MIKTLIIINLKITPKIITLMKKKTIMMSLEILFIKEEAKLINLIRLN